MNDVSKSLFGASILLTNPIESGDGLKSKLRDLHAEVIHIPFIEIQPISKNVSFCDSLKQLADYDYVVFTSKNAIKIFFQTYGELGLPKEIFGMIKFGCVGDASRILLESYGISDIVMPDVEFTAASLAETLMVLDQNFKDKKVLFPAGSLAKDTVNEILTFWGMIVKRVNIYETVPAVVEKAVLMSLFTSSYEYAVFTSPSGIKNFVKCLGYESCKEIFQTTTLVCIGSVTEEAVREFGFENVLAAEKYTNEGVIEAIVKEFAI